MYTMWEDRFRAMENSDEEPDSVDDKLVYLAVRKAPSNGSDTGSGQVDIDTQNPETSALLSSSYAVRVDIDGGGEYRPGRESSQTLSTAANIVYTINPREAPDSSQDITVQLEEQRQGNQEPRPATVSQDIYTEFQNITSAARREERREMFSGGVYLGSLIVLGCQNQYQQAGRQLSDAELADNIIKGKEALEQETEYFPFSYEEDGAGSMHYFLEGVQQFAVTVNPEKSRSERETREIEKLIP